MKKNHDYGASWTILRLPSITDQLYIKAARIRSIEENKAQKVDDPIDLEYVGLINYSIMGLILIENLSTNKDLNTINLSNEYDLVVQKTRDLFENKNHDYGEIWREMRLSSYTDLILMKLLRIKQIEDQKGYTLVSEGIDSGYMDIINYSIFALIKLLIEK